MWQAHALLTIMRQGVTSEMAKYLVPHMEMVSKKVLRSLGFSQDWLNKECPQSVVDRFIHLAEQHPDILEIQIHKSVQHMVSRN